MSIPTKTQPIRLTPFIGREADIQRILGLFEDPAVRLVTVLGPGGVGKTRFALEAVSLLESRFKDGAVFVPLASLTSVDEFLPALAGFFGVQLEPGSSLQHAVEDHLSARQALLVLDNCEHLLEIGAMVEPMLAAAPQVKALVTSREKLGLECETLFHLSGLDFPPSDSSEKVEEYDAVRLFLQKARQVQPGYSLRMQEIPPVIQICRMVDGNPLGLLLAAAWVEHFSPSEIVEQVRHSLDFLTSAYRDTEPRHSSMRAVFNASYERLPEADQAVFRKLSVFPGSFDLPAAQAVAGADLLTVIRLVEKSLLTRQPGAGRYDMHELMRQYAAEELTKACEREPAAMAHARYYSEFIWQRETRLISPAQAAALDEIQLELSNIRQACATLIEAHDFAGVRSMLPCIYAFCDMRSRFHEGEAIFRQAAEGLAPQTGEAPHAAWALALLSWYDIRIYTHGHPPAEPIKTQAQRCLEKARAAHDAQAIAASLVLLGAIEEDQKDYESAVRRYKEALQVDPSLDDVYWVNMRVGLAYQATGSYSEAIEAFQTSLRRGQETGERLKAGWSLVNIGDTLILLRRESEAAGCLEQARSLFEEVGAPDGMLWAHFSLSRVCLQLGDPQPARQHAEIARGLARQIHSASWIEKTDSLLKQIDSAGARRPAAAQAPGEITFTRRELEVLRLLKSEMSGPEIARTLYVSLNTIHYHTKNIYQKLEVRTRLEAIRRAKELGL